MGCRITVRQPIIRKAVEEGKYTFAGVNKGKQVTIKEGQAVILDLAKAGEEPGVKGNAEKQQVLMSQLSIADKFGVFAPRRVATISLTSMIKFVAQMKNPRRGHDAQGKLKKINLDSTPEGYANYMAPGRVSWIEQQVKKLDDHKEADEIFTDDILRPQTDTYLTPTWDEFVPFPMTWKIRFDGFGESDYKVGTNDYGRVKTTPTLPDFCPPWYQPQGPSTEGGAFASTVCICADEGAGKGEVDEKGEKVHKKGCPCVGGSKKKSKLKTAQLSTGCGLSDNCVHK